MADPTRASIQTAYSNAVKILAQSQLYGRFPNTSPPSGITSLLTTLNTLDTALVGDYTDEASDAAQAIRSLLAGIVSPETAASMLRPWLKTYCKSVIGRTDLSNDSQMIQEIYRYLHDNSIFLQSRAFTFGTPTAGGSNVGTTQLLRCSTDAYNYPIESGYVDSKRALCILDSNTGTSQGNEVWQIVGQARARDDIQRSGSGQEGTVTGLTIDDSLLTNAGFRAYSGTAAAPTGLTGWTSQSGDSSTYYTIDTTNYFRAAPSDSTPSSLVLQASNLYTQKLTVRGTELSPNAAYALIVIWNRSIGTGSGTLTFRLGSQSTAISVSAQSGWQVSKVPNTFGSANWYRNFAQTDLQIEMQWKKTSGTVNIAEILLVPGTVFDNHWYWMVPSSATWVPPRINDTHTWPDLATATTAQNQEWLSRAFPGAYWPSRNGSSVGWAST